MVVAAWRWWRKQDCRVDAVSVEKARSDEILKRVVARLLVAGRGRVESMAVAAWRQWHAAVVAKRERQAQDMALRARVIGRFVAVGRGRIASMMAAAWRQWRAWLSADAFSAAVAAEKKARATAEASSGMFRRRVAEYVCHRLVENGLVVRYKRLIWGIWWRFSQHQADLEHQNQELIERIAKLSGVENELEAARLNLEKTTKEKARVLEERRKPRLGQRRWRH